MDFYKNEICFIEKNLRLGNAYILNIDNIGNYICMHYIDNPYKSKIIPIEHKEVSNFKKYPTDYVIWIPGNDEHSHTSPWGNGKPSANLFVLGMFK